MKKLNPVNIHVDSDVDADDLGHRLTECIENMSTNTDVINIVKCHVGDNVPLDKIHGYIFHISKMIKDMGGHNCIFVPIKKDFIEDITVEYVKVISDDLDNRTD